MSSFQRPTLTELIDRITADISRGVTGVDGAVVRRSLLGILAKTEAGAIHHLYGYLDWIADQAIIDTSTDEFLERWAAIWDISRKQATFTIRKVLFSGTNDRVIPVDTILQRPDGLEFKVTVGATVAAGTALVTVQALATGSDSVTATGVLMQLSSPISGVQSAGAVQADGAVDGVDKELDDSLKTRLLQRIRNPPQGGAKSDYETWALEVPGVTRAWVYPLEDGAGTVSVRFTVDNDGVIPDAGKIEEVQDYIEAPYRRPVTADVTVKALTGVEMDVSVQLDPNNAATRAAVTAELDDLIRRDSIPGGKILISRIREAVSVAAGELNNIVLSPTADFETADEDEIAIPGTYTFAAVP
jgi:uncharacterized phage protein gp47/JayE